VTTIEEPVRVTTIGNSGKTAPVHLARCSRTQQLSGPLTEMNRCVTSQLVVPVGSEVTVAEVGDEELLHAANVKATARTRSCAFKTSLSLDQDSTPFALPSSVRFCTRCGRFADDRVRTRLRNFRRRTAAIPLLRVRTLRHAGQPRATWPRPRIRSLKPRRNDPHFHSLTC
jgi:hypothetical protein